MLLKKIEQLYEINSRLPINAKNERIICWSLQKHVI
jgi:hypothetical protein